jgi:hypothetical protein
MTPPIPQNTINDALLYLYALAKDIGCDRIDIRIKADGRVEAECVGHDGSPFGANSTSRHSRR